MQVRLSVSSIAICAVLASCGAEKPNLTTSKEAIDSINAPEGLIGAGTMERQLAALAVSGRVTGVWTSDYWPDSTGGTARRKQPDQLSPMEKYDAVTNRSGLATNWERAEAARNAATSWAGHCNGLTAAGMRTAEPLRSVQYRGVEFSADDVKALLMEAYMGTGRLVGRRCDRSDLAVDPMGRPTEPACRDLNPGSLHLALGNFIGAHQLPLIIDLSPDAQVWNYSVTSYTSRVRWVNEDEAKRLVHANSARPYPFHQNARGFAAVSTDVELLLGKPSLATFEYLLELDDRGAIIGGEWLGATRLNHPDFVWRPERQPRPLNPHLDTAIIREIYQASIN